MKTARGLETYANFYLGADEKFATNLFGALMGEQEIKENSIITMDLTKRQKGVPYPMAILYCNCDHLAFNTKIITKEIFKQMNLQQPPGSY